MNVDVTDLNLALKTTLALVKAGRGAYVCISNVHMCMEAFDSNNFAKIVNNANLVVPDGKPLSWAQRILGSKEAKQVRGQDLMNALCDVSVRKKLRIGLYGGSSNEVLNKVKSTLELSYPGVDIGYSFVPPFRTLTEEEDSQVVREINFAKIDVLFVGIGCPKQEYWMAQHRDQLNCVMLGVGAAFDLISSEKRHAPRWMQNIGMEWMFRLMSEPKRLWRRYLTTNPRFILYFAKQFIKYRFRNIKP